MPARRNDVERLEGVLVHDGECAFCAAAATALRRLPAVGAVEWSDPAARAFLAAQFGEPPFAVVFVDAAAGRVHLGREAAVELCGRAGVPALVRDVVDGAYERAADAVRTVVGADREPDPYHDTVPLAEPAREPLEALLEAASPASYVVTD